MKNGENFRPYERRAAPTKKGMVINMNILSNKKNRTHIIVLSVAVLLVIVLIASALIIALSSPIGKMQGKAAISAKAEELKDVDLGHASVWQYFNEYGIGNFDYRKLANLEKIFADWYIMELPKTHVHAYSAAKYFLENEYDKVNLENEEAVTDALMRAYTNTSGDDYAFYRTFDETNKYIEDMSGTFAGIGVSVESQLTDTGTEVGYKIVSVIEGGGAKDAGLLAGDLIVAVDGVEIRDMSDWSEVQSAIAGEVGTSVSITIYREGVRAIYSCERRIVTNTTVSTEVDSNGVALIKITEFNDLTGIEFAEALDSAAALGAKGFIFDLRNNPGGSLASVITAISQLVPNDTEIVSYRTKQSGDLQIETAYSERNAAFKHPIVVLCNENTASAGELFTSAVRDYCDMGILDAVIVGNTTYGKGIMQSTKYILPSMASITLTMAYYDPPSRVNYHGIGITPDILLTDKDEQMTRAYTEIGQMIAAKDGVAA